MDVKAQSFKNIEVVATFAIPSTTGTLDVTRDAEAAGTVMQLRVVINHVKPGLIRRSPCPSHERSNCLGCSTTFTKRSEGTSRRTRWRN
jgi:hypothetical protein